MGGGGFSVPVGAVGWGKVFPEVSGVKQAKPRLGFPYGRKGESKPQLRLCLPKSDSTENLLMSGKMVITKGVLLS